MLEKLARAVAALLRAGAACLASAQPSPLRAAVFVPTKTVVGEMCNRFVEHVNAT